MPNVQIVAVATWWIKKEMDRNVGKKWEKTIRKTWEKTWKQMEKT